MKNRKKSFLISVLYRDSDILVVDKPVDLPVHKNDFMPNDAPYLTKLLGMETGKWIYNVHRLDAKTSGVMVLALSKEVANRLALQFERKEVKKKYQAVVRGNPGEGFFDSRVVVKKKTRFKKPALTTYTTRNTIKTDISYKTYDNIELSRVEVIPETGRWHQIRQHFAANRFDIIGDTHHGDFALNKIVMEKTKSKRLFLHASELEFMHPSTGKQVHFNAPLPVEFENLFAILSLVDH